MSPTPRRFLFLIRHPPVAGLRGRETLDRILTVAAFDQWVTLIFIDDGVFHLAAPTSVPHQEKPAWLRSLGALELYEIHELLVDEDSLRARGLGGSDLAIGAEVTSRNRIRALLSEHDRLFVC